MLRGMACLVVDVNVRSLDVGKRFDLDLQRFGAVVRFSDCEALIKYDIDFDDQAWTRVPGTHGVEGDDLRVVGHG